MPPLIPSRRVLPLPGDLLQVALCERERGERGGIEWIGWLWPRLELHNKGLVGHVVTFIERHA